MGTTGTRRDPLAPHWLACELDPPRAGADAVARVVVENAGSATWRPGDGTGLRLAYHWLDPLGNPIVWDGLRTELPHPVGPGERLAMELRVRAPRPPGRYRLSVDLVEEHRFWLGELGCPTLDVDVDVGPGIGARRLAVAVAGGDDARTRAALAAQDEPLVEGEADAVAHLVAGATPDPDWSRRVLDAHEEGYAAVGVAIVAVGSLTDRRREARRLAAWAPGGRSPRFGHPLLLPSLVNGLVPGIHLGLPAYDGPDGLFDGRSAIRLPTRSGRRPG